jgi:hypothetical protein
MLIQPGEFFAGVSLFHQSLVGCIEPQWRPSAQEKGMISLAQAKLTVLKMAGPLLAGIYRAYGIEGVMECIATHVSDRLVKDGALHVPTNRKQRSKELA